MFIKNYNLILLQLILFGTASSCILLTGWCEIKSILLGGSAWFIPGLYFLWKMQRISLDFDNKKMVKHFFLSESVKLLLSFVIIILVLLVCDIDRKSFLSGYISMILISFVVPLKSGVKGV